MTLPPSHPIVIAIDGPAASGKGTLAKGLARTFGFGHLDSGLFYRAYPDIADQTLKAGDEEIAELFGTQIFGVNAVRLRDEKHAQRAAMVASDPLVRATITRSIRALCLNLLKNTPGIVIDGRDIGTVVFPDADAKLYVTASVEARAERRWKEMQARGETVTLEAIAEDLRRRDERDRTRAEAPLRAAEDAVVIDTSEMAIDEAIAAAIEAVDKLTA